MTFLIANWFLILAALVSGGLVLWSLVTGGGFSGGIKAADTVLLMNREKAVVVDVCASDEFAAGHVVGARNIPLADLEAKLPGAVKNKALPVILVCASGVRSGRAVAIAKKLGYDKAQSLEGGMKAWRAASLPVEKA